ncbi:MAG: Uma2 family endonuclease [Opitutus sp.]|nr:Uma2 family endonuclease [Opitutus sp.]
METAVKVWTDEELMALPKDGCKRELLQGEIIKSPAGSEHGIISVAVCAELRAHARRHQLGAVFDSSTGFRLTPDDLLSPDAAFVSRDRLVAMKRIPRGFFPGAPDLVVEVLSPSDTIEYVHEKLTRYFAHGTRLVWVINPVERNALVYRTPEADRLLRVTDALDGEDVLPGFRLPLAELFAELSFE